MKHRIRIPHTHYDIRESLFVAYIHGRNLEENLIPEARDNSIRCYQTVRPWEEAGEQVYFVEETLIPMFERTDVSGINLADLHWPFEAFCLVFPRSYNVQTAFVCRKDNYLRIFAVHRDGSDYSFVERIPDFDMVTSFERETTIPRLTDEQLEILGLTEQPDDDESVQADLRDIVRMALSALLFMNAKPECITQEPGITYPKKHKKDQRPWVNPRWLGRSYQPKTRSSGGTTEPSGNHVRAHWRRGHWRNQPYGPRDQVKHKIVWIEPIYVGSPG